MIGKYFDILNPLGVVHECVIETDEQTNGRTDGQNGLHQYRAL